MGAIMCMGVGTANRHPRRPPSPRNAFLHHGDPVAAATEGRLQPRFPALSSMTALAMIIGMIPMAPRPRRWRRTKCPHFGRAVIGGLLFATVATLIFVPAVFQSLAFENATPGAPRFSGRK